MKKAVLFIVFNRIGPARRVFEAIRRYKPPYLYIAADGPRDYCDGEDALCQDVRSIVSDVDWACEVKTLFRDENVGCGKAVSSAISWFFSYEEQGIILEDDCLPSLSFFYFCEAMLDKWSDHPEVMMITGSNYFLGEITPPPHYYFSRYAIVWGWATWRNAWDLYDYTMQKSKSVVSVNALVKYLDHSKMAHWLAHTLEPDHVLSCDAWGPQWNATIIYHRGYCIVPTCCLLTNIGEFGAHGHDASPFNHMPIQPMDIESIEHPAIVRWGRQYDFKMFETILKTEFTLRRQLAFRAKKILRCAGLLPFARKVKNAFGI